MKRFYHHYEDGTSIKLKKMNLYLAVDVTMVYPGFESYLKR